MSNKKWLCVEQTSIYLDNFFLLLCSWSFPIFFFVFPPGLLFTRCYLVLHMSNLKCDVLRIIAHVFAAEWRKKICRISDAVNISMVNDSHLWRLDFFSTLRSIFSVAIHTHINIHTNIAYFFISLDTSEKKWNTVIIQKWERLRFIIPCILFSVVCDYFVGFRKYFLFLLDLNLRKSLKVNHKKIENNSKFQIFTYSKKIQKCIMNANVICFLQFVVPEILTQKISSQIKRRKKNKISKRSQQIILRRTSDLDTQFWHISYDMIFRFVIAKNMIFFPVVPKHALHHFLNSIFALFSSFTFFFWFATCTSYKEIVLKNRKSFSRIQLRKTLFLFCIETICSCSKKEKMLNEKRRM